MGCGQWGFGSAGDRTADKLIDLCAVDGLVVEQ